MRPPAQQTWPPSPLEWNPGRVMTLDSGLCGFQAPIVTSQRPLTVPPRCPHVLACDPGGRSVQGRRWTQRAPPQACRRRAPCSLTESTSMGWVASISSSNELAAGAPPAVVVVAGEALAARDLHRQWRRGRLWRRLAPGALRDG